MTEQPRHKNFRLLAVGLTVACVFLLSACGGGSPETVTETVTVGETSPRTDTGSTAEPEGSVEVEQTRLIYQPNQTGGNFHIALVLLRNNTDEVVIDVGGQISILDEEGTLVKSLNPSPVTILPGERGLFVEDAVNLPKPVPNGRLEVTLGAPRFREAASSPVTFSKLKYERSTGPSGLPCNLTGTVSNTFSEPKDNLQLRAAAFDGETLAVGGLTYVDQVFPERDATFDIPIFDIEACPTTVSRVEVYPNMSEDKIYER